MRSITQIPLSIQRSYVKIHQIQQRGNRKLHFMSSYVKGSDTVPTIFWVAMPYLQRLPQNLQTNFSNSTQC